MVDMELVIGPQTSLVSNDMMNTIQVATLGTLGGLICEIPGRPTSTRTSCLANHYLMTLNKLFK